MGIDIARNLVDAGNRRATEEGLTNCRFELGDASNLDELRNDSFDLIVSIFGAMFASEPVEVAKEMVHVTRPGGRIVMGNWIPDDPTLVAQILKVGFGLFASTPSRIRQPHDLGLGGDGDRPVRRGRHLRRERLIFSARPINSGSSPPSGTARGFPELLWTYDEHVRSRRGEWPGRRVQLETGGALRGSETSSHPTAL